MKIKLLCVIGLFATSTASMAGGNHGANGDHTHEAPSYSAQVHTANEAEAAKQGHKNINDCTRKGVNMLMELDKFLVIPTEDKIEIDRFFAESKVMQSASVKEKDLFLTLASKKNEEGMSAAKVKKLFAEAIVERCK